MSSIRFAMAVVTGSTRVHKMYADSAVTTEATWVSETAVASGSLPRTRTSTTRAKIARLTGAVAKELTREKVNSMSCGSLELRIQARTPITTVPAHPYTTRVQETRLRSRADNTPRPSRLAICNHTTRPNTGIVTDGAR